MWGWDAYGNRTKQEIPYSPYIYLEDKRGDAKSIYGTSLKKKEFLNQYERGKFVKESGVKRIFEDIKPYQQFLIDEYHRDCEKEEFSKHPLKVCIIDIENPNKNSMPDIETADTVINLLTCYDSLTKRYTVFGLKAYKKKRDDVDYYHCKSEHDLLKRFIGHFSSDYPDVVSGWNSSGYDLPYLINRITFELGKEWADELSPTGRIYEKMNPTGKYGMPSKEYVIEGISSLDYMTLYKKFEVDKKESYKLDYIAELELGENKVEYDGSLWDLSVNDWETFVDYNIVDVELIAKLDKKLDYFTLIRFIAYNALCGFQEAINTVPVINGVIAIKARERGEFIPTFVKGQRKGEKNPGGYVQDVKPGFVRNMVTFDANSLYPSVMISLNISPETKLGRVEKVGDKYNIHHVSGRTFELEPDKFVEYLKEEKVAISKSNHLFSQKRKGIMPEFLDNLYTKRKEMKYKGKTLEGQLYELKNEMSDDEILKMKNEIQRCDTFQNAYKIILNSAYGYTGNPYAPLADDDIATSVTLTGQAVNKKNKDLFMNYLIDQFGVSEIDAENSCVAGDTDSGMFSLFSVEKEYPLMDGDRISEQFFKLCDDIENHINTSVTEWAKKTFRTEDCRLVYKREAICDCGIFVAKKNYLLHMLDDEGNKVDKFKYRGLSVVKTTMPKLLKPYVKNIMETMVMERSLEKTNKLFFEAYDTFKKLPIETQSRLSGLNTFYKYEKDCDKFRTAKGMQAQMRAAHYHNVLLDELQLTAKYQKLKTGDKIRYIAVKKPNKYNIDLVGYMGKFPKEFTEIFDIDHDIMFDDLLFKSIEKLYVVVNWKLRKPNENVKIELEDFLS